MDLPLAAIFSIFFLLMLTVLAGDRRAARKTLEALGSSLEARADVLDVRMKGGFDTVNARFDVVDKKIAELDRDVHAVMQRMMDR